MRSISAASLIDAWERDFFMLFWLIFLSLSTAADPYQHQRMIDGTGNSLVSIGSPQWKNESHVVTSLLGGQRE